MPVRLEIHGQECGVHHDVAPAQPLVELQAVQDPGTVVQAEDVLRQQVAVAGPDEPGALAVVEQADAAVEVLLRQRRHGVEAGRREHALLERRQLLAALAPQRPASSVRGRTPRERAPRRCRAATWPATSASHRSASSPRSRTVDSRRADRHPPHHEHRLADGAGQVQGAQLAEPEVDVGGDGAVELEFAQAVPEPRCRRAEIEEREGDRLLALVDQAADEHEHARVRLHDGGVRLAGRGGRSVAPRTPGDGRAPRAAGIADLLHMPTCDRSHGRVTAFRGEGPGGGNRGRRRARPADRGRDVRL